MKRRTINTWRPWRDCWIRRQNKVEETRVKLEESQQNQL